MVDAHENQLGRPINFFFTAAITDILTGIRLYIGLHFPARQTETFHVFIHSLKLFDGRFELADPCTAHIGFHCAPSVVVVAYCHEQNKSATTF